MPADRQRILNSITRQPLDSVPMAQHDEYDRVNCTLRSMLAVHAAYKSAEAGRLAQAVHVAVQGKSRKEEYTCLSKIGLLLRDMGKLADAEPLLRRALEGREATLGKSHPDTLTSINDLGWLLQGMGKVEDAEPLYRRALEGQEATLGKSHPDTLISINNLGMLL